MRYAIGLSMRRKGARASCARICRHEQCAPGFRDPLLGEPLGMLTTAISLIKTHSTKRRRGKAS